MLRLMIRGFAWSLSLVGLVGGLAQAYEHGDAVPEDFKMPDPHEPSASLELIDVGEGLRVEQVVAEPLVADPIAFDWGPDGRLWVVEMADYPLGLDGKNQPGGRVRFLTDSDDDGDYDTSSVFLKDIGFPTSVKVWRNGVLVVTAPEIFYAEDRDGDGVADHRETLFRGFREGNQQHRVNGLVWSLDNRLVLANGDSGGTVESVKTGIKVELGGYDLAVHPDTGEMQLLTGRTQYGRVRDDAGNWFGCSNSRPLFHFVLPGDQLKRNPHVVYPASVVQVPEDPHAPRVYPTSEQALRYNDPFARSRITSACGIGVQRDPRLGIEIYGDVFVCEPVHNLVSRIELHPKGSTFVGRRAESEQESEIFASADPWCRPVYARTGPDGAMWIADMYRFVIEHPEWIPAEWQKVLDLRAGSDRGRIYRIVSDGTAKSAAAPDFTDLEPAELVAALASENGWQRDMVHQMLWWRRNEPAVATAIKAQKFVDHALARMHRLALLPEETFAAQGDSDPRVRRLAFRLSPNPNPDITTENDPQARLELAFSLGRREAGSEGAGKALAELATRHGDDEHLVAAVMSSLLPHFDEFVSALDPDVVSPSLRRPLFETAIATGKFSAVAALLNVKDPAQEDLGFVELLAVLDRRKIAFASFEERVGDQAQEVLARALGRIELARADFVDTEAELDRRIAAVALLGRTAEQRERDLSQLVESLKLAHPVELQIAVVGRLAQMREFEALLELLPKSLPAVQQSIVAICLADSKAAEILLDFVEQKQVGQGVLSAMQRDRLRAFPNGKVRSRARVLFGDRDVGNEDRARVVADFQSVLELEGDADAGRQVFAQACVACHQLDGVGQAIGADLTALSDKSSGALLTGILDPNRAVEDKYLLYTVETKEGGVLAGLLQEETNANVRVALLDGQIKTVLRSDIVSVENTGRSLMPDGLEAAIDHQQMADLIAYLQVAGTREDKR